MKQILIILSLFASVSTFAQSPRIKLNQITKDTVTGSVLISSPSDSGMVYSRDFYIAYGLTDTVLILYGDTLAATSGIISSVLSDGVTITGDGTSGNELKVDTATVISTIQGLVDSLFNYVTTNTNQTITGAKTFTNTFTQSGGDANFDNNTLYVDESANSVGIGTSTPSAKVQVDFANYETGLLFNNTNTQYALIGFSALGVAKTYIGYNTSFGFFGGEFGVGTVIQSNGSIGMYMDTARNVYIGDGLVIGTQKLDVNGNARFRSIGSGASAGALHYTSDGTLTTNTSDVRLKTNLQPLENTLNKLLGINTYTFNWIDETDRVDLGMIAQEVEQIFPNLVFTNNVDGYKGIHYDKFSSILTKAIQEQQAIIETQASEIEQLKTLITDLTNRLTILENK